MIGIRHMAVAFIQNDSKWLMLKRHDKHKIASGVYAPVGGHLECDEFQNPVDACIREVYEETGLETEQLNNVELKYIILRRKDTEIRIQYVYFLTTQSMDIASNDEGELHWVDTSEILELQTTYTTHEVIKHYLTQSTFEDPVLIGTVDSTPTMHFVKIEDFEHPYLK